MTTTKLSAILELKAGDTSAIKAVNAFDESFEELNAELESAKKSGGLRGFAVGAEDLEKAERKLSSVRAEAVLVARELNKAILEMKKTDEGSEAFDRASAKVQRLKVQLDDLNNSAQQSVAGLADYGNRFQQTSDRASVYGDADSAVAAVSGLVGATGAAGAASGIMVGSDILATAEALPRLGIAVTEMGKRLAEGEGLVSRFASTAGTMLASITGLSGGMASFLAVAGPIALAIAAATAALALMNEALRQQEAGLRAAQAAQQQYYELLGSGATSEDAQQELQNAQRRLAAARAEREEIQRVYDETFSRASEQYGDAFARLATAGFTAFSGGEEVFAERARTLDQEIANLEASTGRLQSAVESGAFAQNDSIEQQIAAIERRAAIEQETAALIATGTTDQVAARRQQVQAELDSINSLLPQYQALAGQSAEAAARVEELTARQADLTALDTALAESVEPVVALREQEAEAARSQVAAFQYAAQESQRIAQLTREATVEQVEARQQALADEIAATEQLIANLQTLAGTSEEAAAALSQAEFRLGQLRSESSRLENDVMPAARRRQIQEGKAELIKAETEAKQRRVEIAAEYKNRVTEIETSAAKAREKASLDAAKAVAALDTKYKQATSAANKSYFDGEKKALEDFRRAELKAESAYQKQRLRRIEDLREELLTAEEDNDVVAFIRAKRRADTDLERMTEDRDDGARERQEQYKLEREAAYTAHQEKLQQIEESTAAERVAIQTRLQESLAAIETQRQEQLAAAAQARETAMRQEQEALARTLAAIRQKYDLEKDAARQSAEQKKGIEIAAGRQAAGQIRDSFIQAANQAASSIRAALSAAASSSRSGGSTAPRSGGANTARGRAGGLTGSTIAQFAYGAIAPAGKRVIAEFEPTRNYAEAAVPLTADGIATFLQGVRQSRNASFEASGLGKVALPAQPIATGAGGYGSITWTGNVVIGEGAGVTPNEVRDIVNESFNAFARGIRDKRLGQ